MNADRKSDESVVPAKSANNGAAGASAESTEERDSAKRNAAQAALPRTPGRTKRKTRGLHGVREAARKDSTLKFTALLHHVNEDCLTEAFFNLKKTAAVGIDGVTWHEYERNLEANMADLHDRIHRGAYRAQPSRRVWIPKPDGRQRPLGIASLEDKIVQQAVLWVLQSIYEQDFLGFSYGFRSGRGQHDALDALSVAITSKRVNWILDADIEGFFDAIDHEWLVKFLEHRIGDRRVVRLIRKWLRAGVSEEGEWSKTTVGAPQGSVISPLLSNVYLHYVFDRWIEWWRKRHCRGDVVVVRYAIERRQRHGQDRPETFDFLGFTHKCAKTRKHGRFTIHRFTMAKRMRATLQAIKAKLRKRMHRPLGETNKDLTSRGTSRSSSPLFKKPG
jgi:retron-type reverse transcriptase